jgi:hypothetical protein
LLAPPVLCRWWRGCRRGADGISGFLWIGAFGLHRRRDLDA